MKNFSAVYDNEKPDSTMSITVHGSLTSIDAIRFKAELVNKISESHDDFRIDLRGLKAMDVAGVNALVIAQNTILKLGRKMTLLGSDANAAFEFLHLTKFINHFNFAKA